MKNLEFCTVEDEGRVRLITLNRPEVLNALHSAAHHELETVWDDFASRDDLWVAIVTGAGERAFSAGNDLKVQAAGKSGPPARSGFGGLTRRFDLDKPVIAAVNGFALGGGFEIVLACDIVVAVENAVFGLPEPRVGLVAGAGGLHRLMRMIPQKEALGLILTGGRMGAEEARRLGLVNEVVPPGQAVATARKWAAAIVECSPMAVRAAKQAAYRGLDEVHLRDALETVYPGQQANRDSLDFLEGPRAFAEKRKPEWKNR